MTTVAILGGAGFIGQRFFDHASGLHCSVIDRSIDGSDLTRPEGWVGIDQWRPDTILNLVANLDTRDTAVVVLRLVDWILKWHEQGYYPHLVHLSSAAVYGEAHQLPIREEMSEGAIPMSLYGLDKQIGEKYLLYAVWYTGFNLPVTVIRPANVYGPGQGYNVVRYFLEALQRNESPVIHQTGSTIRDFVHVDDVCRALRLCVDNPSDRLRILNIGTGVGTTLFRLADTLRAQFGWGTPAPLIDGVSGGGSAKCPMRSASPR